MKLGFPFSIAALFWVFVGLLRYISEKRAKLKMMLPPGKLQRFIRNVAICVPAHNEANVIGSTLHHLKKLVASDQIYVVSDGSDDQTVRFAKDAGCSVLELYPGRGKAVALKNLIQHFRLLDRYAFIFFVDADTRINPHYLRRALWAFERQPDLAAVAGYVITAWRKHRKLSIQRFIAAYRVRLNRVLQALVVYGQTWRYSNAAWVIPGSASIYRSRVLKQLQLATPGLIIEDFSLAFQIHKKRLGKIANFPQIYSFDEEPLTLSDYWKQVKRWNIGYYQTIRKHGIWPSYFWISTGIFTFEVLVNAAFMVLMPVVLVGLTVIGVITVRNPDILQTNVLLSRVAPGIAEAYLAVFILDYLLTLGVSIKDKKPLVAVYGLGFLFFRVLDSLILISSLPSGLFRYSSGRWTPPKRRR